MSIDDPKDLENIDQEIRINELKEKAKELTGGQMTCFEAEDCPPDISEQFWRNVVEYEKAPWTTHHKQLEEAGIAMPPADELDDAQLHAKLWEIVQFLAGRRVFLGQTNHLSDREFYTHLREDSFHEEFADMGVSPYGAYHIDLLGSGSEEDMFLYHKYYASEEDRQRWLADFPNTLMPPHEDPLYDRDRLLPGDTEIPPGVFGLEEGEAGPTDDDDDDPIPY